MFSWLKRRSDAAPGRSAREEQEALAREGVVTGRAGGAKDAREAMAMSLARQPTEDEWREHGAVWERNWLRAYLESLRRRGA